MGRGGAPELQVQSFSENCQINTKWFYRIITIRKKATLFRHAHTLNTELSRQSAVAVGRVRSELDREL